MKYPIFIFLVISHLAFSQEVVSPFTTLKARQDFSRKLQDTLLGQTLQMSVSPETENRWIEAFWAMELGLQKTETVKDALVKAFNAYQNAGFEFKRSLLEAVYCLYPTDFQTIVLKILETETHPKLFAMASVYWLRAKPESRKFLLKTLQKRFPKYKQNPLLSALKNHISAEKIPEKTPSVPELFKNKLSHNQKVVYSFQRWNRDFPGLSILQNPDGSFAKHDTGKLLVFEQFARSSSNLPYFLTNGNTPQGIYSVQEIVVSENVFIGPTPALVMYMPYEIDSSRFFLDKTKNLKVTHLYRNLLPKSWQKYRPMYESLEAGKIGRTEIIAHGTTIDTSFYQNEKYYPFTPSLGCLTAKEIWNPETGSLRYSSQQNLLNAYKNSSGEKGYVMVINIDNQQKTVSREEIEKWVREFEEKFF